MPRVTPISSKSDVPAEAHAVTDGVVKVFGQIRGPFSMLLHNPKLAERMLAFVNYFREEGVVDQKDRSLAILVAARERQGAYVWAAQVNAARRAGVREEAIDVIRAKGDPGKLSPEERDIVAFAQQLVRNNRVEPATFEALGKKHDPAWLVELTVAAGYYGMLSGVVSAFEVAAPPDGDKLPA